MYFVDLFKKILNFQITNFHFVYWNSGSIRAPITKYNTGTITVRERYEEDTEIKEKKRFIIV